MKDPRLQKLKQLARSLPADERVPYAFEKRIMAHVSSVKQQDVWSIWSALMWRAAVTCVAISIFVGAWARFENEKPSGELLAADLEEAVFAPVHEGEPW
jgi:hypothetical protein